MGAGTTLGLGSPTAHGPAGHTPVGGGPEREFFSTAGWYVVRGRPALAAAEALCQEGFPGGGLLHRAEIPYSAKSHRPDLKGQQPGTTCSKGGAEQKEEAWGSNRWTTIRGHLPYDAQDYFWVGPQWSGKDRVPLTP